MPSFENLHPVAHSADDMFALVADVEKYPEFVPLCSALRVRGRKDLEDGRSLLVADMTVAYKMFRETFTSRVTLSPDRREILVEYLDGPFKHLENRWTFRPTGEGRSEIGFYITYEFKSRTLGTLMSTMFDRAFRKFSAAFEARADHVYPTA
ncbi:type II toxin-antitoxin system RatA family toxin [Stappia indica]|uniref:type II toxin-antitoxin system RatA family toxin n=1 Tax=Stappia indica TaxID=538381 RepID=UPI001CD33164|nr:type II toxin-antitoxin system RatA family toxin [Stappia indica]MCA1297034.1 type II toxin-antitoxin system RatA family toxin [Stappia indica]